MGFLILTKHGLSKKVRKEQLVSHFLETKNVNEKRRRGEEEEEEEEEKKKRREEERRRIKGMEHWIFV